MISQNDISVKFVSKLNKDCRLVIPKNFATKFKDGKIKLGFKLIRNVRRPKSFKKHSKLDILAFIPVKTLSGFEVLAFQNGNQIFAWYFASKGRPNEILLNRRLDYDFARLLGYYRSEGGKPRISIRRGREFSFTNKSVKLVLDFLNLFKKLTSSDFLKASIRHNPKIDKQAIEELRKVLIQNGLKSDNIKDSQAERIREFVIKLYVTNSLLSEIIDNAENILRNYLNKNFDKNLTLEYLRGVLSGDGSFYSYRDKKGSLHSRLLIFESNERAIEDVSVLLKRLGIEGKVKPAKSKMFIFDRSLNWNKLLILISLNLFHLDKEQLCETIKKHKRFKSMKYLSQISKNFTISELIPIIPYPSNWLDKRMKEGIVEITKNKEMHLSYKLTNEGERIATILKSL